MIHVDLTLEDNRVVATRDIPVTGFWSAMLTDVLTGKTHTAVYNDQQMAAIIAVGIEGDESPLYSLAASALADDMKPTNLQQPCPPECSPIP